MLGELREGIGGIVIAAASYAGGNVLIDATSVTSGLQVITDDLFVESVTHEGIAVAVDGVVGPLLVLVSMVAVVAAVVAALGADTGLDATFEAAVAVAIVCCCEDSIVVG